MLLKAKLINQRKFMTTKREKKLQMYAIESISFPYHQWLIEMVGLRPMEASKNVVESRSKIYIKQQAFIRKNASSKRWKPWGSWENKRLDKSRQKWGTYGLNLTINPWIKPLKSSRALIFLRSAVPNSILKWSVKP